MEVFLVGRMGVKINFILGAKENKEEVKTKAIWEFSRKSQLSKTSKSKSSSSEQEQKGTHKPGKCCDSGHSPSSTGSEATEQYYSVL